MWVERLPYVGRMIARVERLYGGWGASPEMCGLPLVSLMGGRRSLICSIYRENFSLLFFLKQNFSGKKKVTLVEK